MIQDPQELTQDFLSLIPNVVGEMPPVSASEADSSVSMTLCLYDPTWPKSSDDAKIPCGPRGNACTEEKGPSLMKLKLLSNEGRKEEEQYGVSTELTLFTDPWTIKKKLTISDRSHQNRLLLNPGTVDSHLVRYLPEGNQKIVQEGWLTVDVYDHDTDSTHQVLLTKLSKRGSYVVGGGWLVDFVTRRALKKKDEIGMYWDRSDSKLHFRVLSRAPTGVSSGPVLAVPSLAPTGVSPDPVLAGPSQDTIGSVTIASYSPLAVPSQASTGVSPGPVLAGPSQDPVGSVTIASYSSLLADP
ncbi:hypothetical protein Bca52824_003921 [Brassica carinata]|uniref:B3 domain-containing protein n=1 Tax=Brassica carinata TaxID=52824 RepID=A0A8X7WMY5_BRACI|nr:hypothetical protein Bca52824_003921 [Brassica carinata]